jgi:hypothetical protein
MTGLPRQRPSELPRLPEEKRWLIEGLWAHQAVGIIGGEPKCCKSFLALDMAVAVASGTPCLGHYRTLERASVLLYAAEDALHIVRERLGGICERRRVALESLELWVVTAPSIRLDLEKDREALRATVAELEPALLVLDPFVRLHRVDENISAEVAPLLAFLRELQRRHGCGVALVHHAKKGASAMRAGQALRGSSELHAWGDSNLYMRRGRNGLTMSIEHRAAPSGADIPVALTTKRGVALALAEHTPHERELTGIHPAPPSPSERVLGELRMTQGPIRARALREQCKMRAATLAKTLSLLEQAGHIVRSEGGWSVAQAASR